MIRWSKRGKLRRTQCVQYIAKESGDWPTAWEWEDAVFEAVAHLEEFPLSGSIVRSEGFLELTEEQVCDEEDEFSDLSGVQLLCGSACVVKFGKRVCKFIDYLLQSYVKCKCSGQICIPDAPAGVIPEHDMTFLLIPADDPTAEFHLCHEFF